MRREMTTHQRDRLLKDYLSVAYRNIVAIRVLSNGVVQVTSQHGPDVYHDAILHDGDIQFDERKWDQ